VDSIIKSASQKIFILSIFDTPLVKTQSTIYFFLMAISAAFTEPSIFFGFLFTISILGVIVNYLLKIEFLSWMKRILGAGIGIIQGILFVSVLLLALTSFLPKDEPIIKNSLFSSYFISVSGKMAKIATKDMRHKYVAKIREYKESWQN